MEIIYLNKWGVIYNRNSNISKSKRNMKKIILKNGKELIIKKANIENAEKMVQYKNYICVNQIFLHLVRMK